MSPRQRLSSSLLALALAGLAHAQDGDPLRAGTTWRGEIRQQANAFPTTIYVQHRDRERVRGEIHFQVGGNLNKLTFQGSVNGSTVAWITDRKEGSVTTPGLYVGTLKGSTLSGTWQVPSAGQYDRFSVELVK